MAGKAETDADAALLEHLASCPACNSRLEAEGRFRDLIKRHAPKAQAPEYLLGKVLDGAALEAPGESTDRNAAGRPIEGGNRELSGFRAFIRPGFVASPGRLLALSTAVLCIALLVVFFSTRPQGGESPTVLELVEDHIRYLPVTEGKQIVSSSCAEVEKWFAGQLDFAVKVPEFDACQLLGGRRCYLFGQSAALVFYEKQGKNLSLFVLEDRGFDVKAMLWKDYANKRVGVIDYKGYHLVFYRKSGLAYALVSDLPDDMLMELTSKL
jgi:anti-sigma factor RsiW